MKDTPNDGSTVKSATEVMAELVARRKAGGRSTAKPLEGGRRSERAAAALSASKSKPAMKKG